ncbi:hypothetical protein CCHL11_07877 [Colletotrichum chlorophyti]|uniref:Uncharacterized protein n=1 Tax=Colletotrichum chlorophyti TaxID=708187 RepID=A0A1Q8RR25_9PEZI|nr:hypothetical protein CCHL11_07877 [Colletotrichum chlorophyti]
MRYLITSTLLAAGVVALTLPTKTHLHRNNTNPWLAPSHNSARERAFYIFNAVHSAMRQWGSSLHHNGLGLIPATVPRGTLLYHGTWRNYTPPDFEWLAFEMEHSENFARSTRGGGKGPSKGPQPPQLAGQRDRQKPMVQPRDDDNPNRGYLHTYRASRDLKLLYIDGMSAGNTLMGTLDTQDLLLRSLEHASPYDDWNRGHDICALVKTWGLDGVIRMEIGFEIMYCDFTDGLDPVSILRTPYQEDREGASIDLFEWVRAVSQLYDGIGAGRVTLDLGRMVSGLWYPVNVTNPEPVMSKHPRLIETTSDERAEILKRVENVVRSTKDKIRVDWQGITDMIVGRYGDRIVALTEEEDADAFAKQIHVITNTFVDYPASPIDKSAMIDSGDMIRKAIKRCAHHFLEPAYIWRHEWTDEDALIYTATETVSW